MEKILQKAIQAHESGNFLKAKKLYKQIIKLNPRNAVANYNLGIIYQNNNGLLKALNFFKIALEANPSSLQYWLTYVDGLIKAELFDDALSTLNHAKKIGAKGKAFEEMFIKLERAKFKKTQNISKEDHKHLLSLLNNEKYYNALIESRNLQKFYPMNSRLYNIIGNAHCGLKQFESAVLNLEKAIDIDDIVPDYYIDLGHVYSLSGNDELAVLNFEKCIQIDPKNHVALYNLGTIYKQHRDYDKAKNYLNDTLKIKPDYANAHNALGYLYHDKKQYSKALKKWEDALCCDPNLEAVRTMKLFVHAQINDWETIEKELYHISKIGVINQSVNPFPLLSLIDDPLTAKVRAILTANTFIDEPIDIKRNIKKKKEKLRIAYFSSDFYEHPVSFLLAKVIESHDRQEFEVFGYSLGTNADHMTERLKKAFDIYKEVASMSDKDIALMCVKDDIDIIIDLNGYTIGARLNIFGYHAAPIQISYLGCPLTSGSKNFDYIIADNVVIPEKFSDYYTEKIIRLPDTYLPTDNTRYISTRKTSRHDLNLPENSFVFCCFNNSNKISAKEFDIWMEIMLEVEDSVLWLKRWNEWSVINLLKEAKKRGIKSSRIIFADQMSMEEHLASYKLADLFIDTFAFNAHTTASEALWAGLPLVTLPGKGFASRVSASLLTAVDLPELISNSKDEYKEIIINLAKNPQILLKLKQKLKNNLSKKPLFNTELYTNNLEHAFRLAHQKYLNGQRPTDISIINHNK